MRAAASHEPEATVPIGEVGCALHRGVVEPPHEAIDAGRAGAGLSTQGSPPR